jgi:hypothetical protein
MGSEAKERVSIMIKIVYCLRRKPGMSIEEFQKYWLETGHPAGKNEPYDGVAELWFEEEDLLNVGGSEGALAAVRDEANFIDFDRSCIFLATEHVILS